MNDLSWSQIATVLNSIHEQATGQKTAAPIDTKDFVAVGQKLLLTGYDNLMDSISQVLSRTIFSVRPYAAKFKELRRTEQQFGNHVRKVQAADRPIDETDFSNAEQLTEGVSIDMFKVKKPHVLQTNFYGATQYNDHITRFKNQLDVAFSNPAELASFIGLYTQNVSDKLEQVHENTARQTLANLIAGLYTINRSDNVIHLLTEYNNFAGTSLTAATVKQPENFPSFVKFMYARINTISGYLTERTVKYHQNLDGGSVAAADKRLIARHTPKSEQMLYLMSHDLNDINAEVLADTFHEDKVSTLPHESLNFWQTLDNPSKIEVKPSYVDDTLTLKTADEIVTVDNIIGLLLDREAAGYTTVNQWTSTTPFNSAGGYTNTFWHFTERYWNDFTENAILFLLD